MQLVSREVLFDVMANKHKVSLSESESSMFQTFCSKVDTEYANAKRKSRPDGINDEMDIFSNAMLKYMKDNSKSIRYVGNGSSRIVFAMADGTALKLAKNAAGIAQNRQEAKVCMDLKVKYEIFPDFYGADKKNWLALNCELCAKAEASDFKELFMAQPIAIEDLIDVMFSAKWTGNWTIDEMLHETKLRIEKEDPENLAAVFLAERLIDNKTQATSALRSLLEFYRQYGLDELLTGDLSHIKNWGLTIRDGQKVLVVVDAGFSNDVWRQHYVETI